MKDTSQNKGIIPMHISTTDDSVVDEGYHHDSPVRRPLLAALLVIVAIGVGTVAATRIHQPKPGGYIGNLSAVARTVTSNGHHRIVKYLVQEGETVNQGSPLVVLIDPTVEQRHLEAKQRIGQLEVELAQAIARTEVEQQWRREELEREIFETQLKSSLYLQRKMSQAVEHIARQEMMELMKQRPTDEVPLGEVIQIRRDAPPLDDRQQMESLLKIHEAKNAMEVAETQVELCDERIEELKKLQQELPEMLRESMGVNVVEQQLADARKNLEQLNSQRAEFTLLAESAGTIGNFKHQPGEFLHPEQDILEILDEEQRFLLVRVPTTDLHKFQREGIVELEFPGNELRKGRVVEIPPQALPAESSPQGGCVTQVAVHVERTGQLWPSVPFGTAVRVRPLD